MGGMESDNAMAAKSSRETADGFCWACMMMWILDFCISFVVFENYERCTAPIKSENGSGVRYDSEDGDDSMRKSVRPVSRSIEVSEGQVNFGKMTCLEMIRRLVTRVRWVSMNQPTSGLSWALLLEYLVLSRPLLLILRETWGFCVGFLSPQGRHDVKKYCHWHRLLLTTIQNITLFFFKILLQVWSVLWTLTSPFLCQQKDSCKIWFFFLVLFVCEYNDKTIDNQQKVIPFRLLQSTQNINQSSSCSCKQNGVLR